MLVMRTTLETRGNVEADFVVSVSGLDEVTANSVGGAVYATASQLEASCGLDLRRLHRVIVAADYGTALQELSSLTISGRPIEYTSEEYARGFAKVLTLPNSGHTEVVVVLDATIGALLATISDDPASEEFKLGLHLLHHELCHVCDANSKLDAFEAEMFIPRGDRRYAVVQPLGLSCWDEYSANRQSVVTAQEDSLSMMAGNLEDAIIRTKPLVDDCILEYRSHADLDRLMSEFGRHGGFLLRSAAYVLGYMDGLSATLEQLAPDTHRVLTGSYFEPVFLRLAEALRDVDALPRTGWDSLDMFDVLGDVVDEYWSAMGLELNLLDDGSLYVDIPFRPDTSGL